VLSLETRDALIRFGAKSMLPGVIVFSIVKESGPIITGLVVAGRVGAAGGRVDQCGDDGAVAQADQVRVVRFNA
jgi:phospholipid/cholesterol/gamma-HCH transport system permease protein